VPDGGGRLRGPDDAAVGADGEAVLGHRLAGRREGPAAAVSWPEVDLPERHLLEVLEAEGALLVGVAPAPVLGLDVDEVLGEVAAALPLGGVVGGLAPQVGGAGRHLGQLEQALLLTQVGPAGAAAVGASDLALRLGVPSHVRADVAEAPLLDL